MESCRIEKAYRSWGHDVSDEDTPLEAGLMFAVKPEKAGGFIGRDALLRQRDAGTGKRLVQFALSDPQPMLYHNEPILRDGAIVGRTSSAAWGHTLGRAVALGYVNYAPGEAPSAAGRWEIEVAGKRIAASASLTPLYDPKGARIRA
jgi:4-methylaminobutanoate oxidase (formaldehyde-forming)